MAEKAEGMNMEILVWGTGIATANIGEKVYEEQISGYIETEKSKDFYKGKPVYSPSELPNGYDAILICNHYGKQIHDCCLRNGIGLQNVCFMYPIPQEIDAENNLRMAKKILKQDWYDRVCVEFGQIDGAWVEEDAKRYTELNTHPTMRIMEEYNKPIYTDKAAGAGSIGSYFWQDLWAARKIYKESPAEHYDIGSRVDGFVAHLLTFMDHVNLIDIRPLDREVDGLEFIHADATDLRGIGDNCMESLSALCSLEHFGLGRYGDRIDPDACYKCFDAIGRKMKKGGNVYLSVPVGREHLEFNAHRIFYASTIMDHFPQFDLIEYSCTYGGYIEYNIDLHKYDEDMRSEGTRFGLFHLRKK